LILVSQADEEETSVSKSFVDFQKAIDAVEPSYKSGMLHNAVTKAATILDQSKNLIKKFIFCLIFNRADWQPKKT